MSQKDINRIVERLMEKPSYMYSGSGLLAKMWGFSQEDVIEAKRIAKEKQKAKSTVHKVPPISDTVSPQDIDKAVKYLLEIPGRIKDRNVSELSVKLNVSKEAVRIAKDRARSIIEGQDSAVQSNYVAELEDEIVRKVDEQKGTLESHVTTDYDPITNYEAKNHKELAILHKVDLNKYRISTYYSKLKSTGKFTSTVFCTLIKIDEDIKAQKQYLLKELKEELGRVSVKAVSRPSGTMAYEINIPDPHFGKMSWAEESGEDYDLGIAEQRYCSAIAELVGLVNTDGLERFIFPIGNDMVNIDSRRNETFAGTRQDSDSRFFKIVRTVKRVLIANINSLSLLAPVDVIVVSGNHDPETMFMIGEILDAYYHNNPNVNIDNCAKQRKYYQYGKCGFQYTHGNEENHKDLGLIFATEQPKLWADTEFRFAKLGHYHKNKKLSYVSVDEYQGFQVQIIPSLSGSDAWHASKGYMSKKAAKGFLYHRDRGLVAEYTYTV